MAAGLVEELCAAGGNLVGSDDQRIAVALSELGEDQRMVFILREYEGLDYAAIAGVTGVSEGTVKSRLFRAKETLRQRLEPYMRAVGS